MGGGAFFVFGECLAHAALLGAVGDGVAVDPEGDFVDAFAEKLLFFPILFLVLSIWIWLLTTECVRVEHSTWSIMGRLYFYFFHRLPPQIPSNRRLIISYDFFRIKLYTPNSTIDELGSGPALHQDKRHMTPSPIYIDQDILTQSPSILLNCSASLQPCGSFGTFFVVFGEVYWFFFFHFLDGLGDFSEVYVEDELDFGESDVGGEAFGVF